MDNLSGQSFLTSVLRNTGMMTYTEKPNKQATVKFFDIGEKSEHSASHSSSRTPSNKDSTKLLEALDNVDLN